MHVKQFNIFAGDAQIDTTFRIQRMRHGLAWVKGEVKEHEMESLILATINQNATIFMCNTHLVHMFNNLGYRDVQILKYEPSNQLLSSVSLPQAITCITTSSLCYYPTCIPTPSSWSF